MPQHPGGTVLLYCDGGMLCRKNPCPQGVRWSVWCAPLPGPGKVVLRATSAEYHTNNEAEWLALTAAFEHAATNYPGRPVVVRSDSQLIVKGFNGDWKIGNLRMRRLLFGAREMAVRVRDACTDLPETVVAVTVEWRPRAELVKRVGH